MGLTLTQETLETLFEVSLCEIQEELRNKSIAIKYLDKGIYCLGIPIKKPQNNVFKNESSLTDTLKTILQAEIDFEKDIQDLGLSLTNLKIDFMESGWQIQSFARPTLIEYPWHWNILKNS